MKYRLLPIWYRFLSVLYWIFLYLIFVPIGRFFFPLFSFPIWIIIWIIFKFNYLEWIGNVEDNIKSDILIYSEQ